MKVIHLVQFILKIIGASPSLSHSPLYRIWGFIILIMMSANLYSYILAFIVNWDDASIFLQSFAMSMGAFSAVAKSTTLVFSQDSLKSILDELKGIVDERGLNHHSKQYSKYHRTEKNYSRTYGLFMFMCSQTIWIGPFISVLVGVYNGQYEYRYPCEVVYLLREETLLEYIAFFLYSALNIQLNAAFLFASDAGFFGINLYLFAAFEDLSDNFGEIENIKETDELSKAKGQKEKFVSCVHFHQKILWLTSVLQDVFSPIIFFQFFFSCLQICANTLELLLHEHIRIDRFIQVLAVYPTILAILFIYCKFGNDLSNKASEISTAIYNSEWYNYPMEVQKLTQILIQQAQIPVIISGFKILPCTLESYTKALQKVGSLLTIMRQLLNK